MKRRHFIILTGIGAASTSLLSACGHPENKLIPAFIPDDEYVPGIDYWKATACDGCQGGCGIVVRTREHKANKIEGNPAHPVNRGALCARGQALLQSHYNPDRLTNPKKRIGERGSGRFADISWNEGIATLAEKLNAIRGRGAGASILLATRNESGAEGLVAEHLSAAYGSWTLATQPQDFIEAIGVGGVRERTVFDIGNASYLVSFGARFLETWQSPVMYSLAYAEFRANNHHGRGTFVQVEPRMSLTGANADQWLPAATGTEGLVALGMARVMVREGLVAAPARPDFISEPLDDFDPEKTAQVTGLSADQIIKVAREFAGARGLAIAGTPQTAAHPDASRAAELLNELVGNAGQAGGPSIHALMDPFSKWRPGTKPGWRPLSEALFGAPPADQTVTAKAAESAPQALLIHQMNPAFDTPEGRQQLQSIPFIASFSSFMDETAAMSDIILPDHSSLERWDLRPGLGVSGPALTVTLSRPVIGPEYDTRQTADVLLAVGNLLGSGMSRELPFNTAEELVKSAAARLHAQNLPGSISESKPEDFWNKLVETGVWSAAVPLGSETPASKQQPTKPLVEPGASAPGSRGEDTPQDDSAEYPFTLLAYEHPALGYGEQANIPWLQEMPDPMSSVIWGSWIEINPKTAASLGISDGDIVEVRSASGNLAAPALIYPAIRPEVVAIPFGQGHSAFGRYASGRGANAFDLLPRDPVRLRGDAIVRVKISRGKGSGTLIRFGTMLPEKPRISR